MIGQLKYNEDTGRIELDDYEFHAGDTLTVLVVNTDGKAVWVQTSIEYSHKHREWYLADLPMFQVSGLFGKLE